MKYPTRLLLLGCVFFLLQDESLAQAEDDVVSSDDIVKSLQQPKTRGLRAIRVQEKPKVDLNIPFERNSSALAAEAEQQLDELSNALLGDSLAKFRFEVAGHTDASGTAEYNRQLSDRRAESVKRFLIDKGIAADRLDSIGYGEDNLLFADDPMHSDNRRVEIRNLGAVARE